MADLGFTEINGDLEVSETISINDFTVEEILSATISSGIHSSGRSSLGSWIRFEDGLQIVWQLHGSVRTTSIGLYNSFYTESNMKYPAAFSEVPIAFPLQLRSAGIQWAGIRATLKDTIDVYLIGGKHRTITGRIGYFAFGRWR